MNVPENSILEKQQPKRVLVVEDDGPLRFVLSEWLRFNGYNVIESTKADDAVIILQSNIIIDFVITDVQMPGKMNGLDLVRYIKKSLPDLNVIGVSSENFKLEFINEDTQFFRKPYNLEEISSHLASIFAISNSENEDLDD